MADRVKPSGNSLLYLYGITEARTGLPETLRGVDGSASIEAIDCAGVTCWTSRVDAVEFGQRLQQNMENLEWLAEASVRHEKVVGTIHDKQAILPARFGTVFASRESLCEDVSARQAALKAGFRRIAGADEWGIRVFSLPKRAAPAAANARSGREYLQQKSAALQTAPARTLEPEIREFAATVDELASATAPGGKVASGQAGLRWHISILLPRARRTKLEALLASFARQWKDRFRVECTGPWAPYSFVGEAQARPSHPAPNGAAQ